MERLNCRESEYWGFFYGRTKYKTSILNKRIYGTPIRVPFEDTELPVPEHYHEYLTKMFGDYMQLPPEISVLACICFQLILVDTN